jgi:hypothetical protein
MAQFSVRARAVDMLGRQQIAGIPTALHELFKNAHDAYARRVEVDYFRAQRQLILRDDGDGMTGEEFVSKWLTLGTESKVNANAGTPAERGPRGLRPRKVLGEKGIGRLAVAAIGPCVLAMTRKDPSMAVVDELTVALVHWGLFEIPGIDLGAIDIPILSLPGGKIPNQQNVKELAGQVRTVIERLAADFSEQKRKALLVALDAVEAVEPQSIDQWLSEESVREGRPDVSLSAQGHGTQFLIAPVDPILDSDIDVTGPWGSSPFQRLLLGFGNTLAGENAEFAAEFRDHRPDGRTLELIGDKSFFTPEEFTSVDHHFEGRFDEFGQFTGTIQLYRGQPQPYVLSWPQAAGRPTECGPFRFKLGYLMGLSEESRLPREEHGPMYDKLNRLGGLYIYRDGVRVLPYGNSDYDFLNIEQRRTLAAKDWFFSYRRMIGWVDITHDENAALVEKAGREGFRENRAYRQFREILEAFFRQLAIDYFRPSAELGDEYRREREKLTEDSDRLKRRDASTRERKRRFANDLQKLLGEIEAGRPATAASELLNTLNNKLRALSELNTETGMNALLDVERESLEGLDALENGFTLARPRGIALSKPVEAAWRSLERARSNLNETLFEPTRAEASSLIEQFRTQHGVDLDRQRRATDNLQREKSASLAEVRKLRREAEQAVVHLDRAVRNTMREEFAEFQAYVEGLVADLGRLNLDQLSEAEARARQRELEQALDGRLRLGRSTFESMREQLAAVATAVVAGDDVEETAAALERRAIELQDRLDLYTDLAQAGSAVGIIGHEFGNVASALRKSVDRLKPWAAGTPALKGIYNDILSYFSELDNYLALFAPLSRRRYRRRTAVSGAYVEKYLLEALASRLDESHVELKITDAFRKRSMQGLLPTILGAALNIVDNALHWATTSDDGEKRVTLDADEMGWTFSNSGPGIALRLEERIFEFGVSTKPGGRGMGLAISRDALRKINCELELLNPGTENHPVFRIAPMLNPEEEVSV